VKQSLSSPEVHTHSSRPADLWTPVDRHICLLLLFSSQLQRRARIYNVILYFYNFRSLCEMVIQGNTLEEGDKFFTLIPFEFSPLKLWYSGNTVCTHVCVSVGCSSDEVVASQPRGMYGAKSVNLLLEQELGNISCRIE
jgi:hypothetical protein